MGDWFKSQWRDIKGNFKWAAIVLIGGYLLTFIASESSKKGLHHPASNFLILVAPPLTLLLILVIVGIVRGVFTHRLDIRALPSGGPNERLTLGIRNRGKQGTFSAFCEIIGHPNGVNDFPKGEFRCGWGDGTLERKMIPHGETESILIASFRDVTKYVLSEMTLWEVIEGRSLEKAWLRWHQGKEEILPSFNIQIRITCEGSKEEKKYTCGVGPASSVGPLKMLIEEGHIL
jgi:hypothetical protein